MNISNTQSLYQGSSDSQVVFWAQSFFVGVGGVCVHCGMSSSIPSFLSTGWPKASVTDVTTKNVPKVRTPLRTTTLQRVTEIGHPQLGKVFKVCQAAQGRDQVTLPFHISSAHTPLTQICLQTQKSSLPCFSHPPSNTTLSSLPSLILPILLSCLIFSASPKTLMFHSFLSSLICFPWLSVTYP